MVNSFESWNHVNEMFGQNRGVEVMVLNGKKYKVVYKIQNDKNFMLKTVRIDGLMDTNSRITGPGAKSIMDFLNSQTGFVKVIGKIDLDFFKTKFIIYKVVKDGNTRDKIQFTIEDRSTVPGLDPTYQFVAADTLEAAKKDNEKLGGVIYDNALKSKENIEGEVGPAPDGSEEDAKGTEQTIRAEGVKFRYTMRTNSKLYTMTFADSTGKIEAVVMGTPKEPNGAISWENNKVMWYTDIDDAGKVSGSPLYMDTEITNKFDKDFFTKIFTDDDFLQKIIDEYNELYAGSEINAENLRSMLYYKDGNRIFPDAGSEAAEGGAGGEGEENVVATIAEPTGPTQKDTF